MNFVKNLVVSLFSLLLFLALTVFGLAFTLKGTVLSPDFVSKEFNNLQISSLVREYVDIQPPPEVPNLNEIIYQASSDIEPQLKTQTDAAIHSVYDYMLGKNSTPDLKSIIKNTYLSTDFVTPLVNNIPVTTLAGSAVTNLFTNALPAEIPNLDMYVNEALTAAEPSFKQQVIAAAGPISDYLLGYNSTLNASISLVQVDQALKDEIYQVFVNSPPPGLVFMGTPVSSVPADQRALYFEQFYASISADIPTTYVIDTNIVTPEIRANVVNGISSAEDELVKLRPYVVMFQRYYTLALVLMILLAVGIILIVRNVKDVVHRLGIPLVTYGAIEYAGILVTRYLLSSGRIRMPDISPDMNAWLLQLTYDSMKPLEVFSLALLAAGIVLIVISFIYKPGKELTWS